MKKYQSSPDQEIRLSYHALKDKKAGANDPARQKFEQSYAKSAVQLQLTHMVAQIVP